MEPLVMFLLVLLVLVVVLVIGFWLIDQIGLPAPSNRIIKGILALIGLVIIVVMVLRLTGHA